jgi:HD-GYP domain-containing protein (c-di-GMP phosphodiesterase class II)
VNERLVVASGPLQGKTVKIVGTVTIGRSPENGLQLNDLLVSRHHAVISRTAAGTVVRDLDSGNGTFVGTERILEYCLTDGDVIRIGPAELRYEREEDRLQDERPAEAHAGGGEAATPEAGDDNAVRAEAAESVYKTFFQEPRDTVDAEELRQAQRRLAALYQANQAISSERDLKRLFARVMEQLFALVPAHNGVILLRDEETGLLNADAPVHVTSGSDEVRPSSTIVARAYERGEAVLTYDAAEDSRFGDGASIIANNIASAMCAPLTHQGDRLGVLYVDTRGTRSAFSQSDLELLVALAGPAAIAIRNAQYVQELEQSYQDTLTVLANAIEMRDHYTVGHTWRVTNVAVMIGRELGWDDDKLQECQMGGVLHDVGKIAVNDAILRKTSELDDEEYAKMKVHPERGANLMRDLKRLVPLIPYALCHHERYDGKGYPAGLAGDAIPIEGRVVAVADAFDAMTSNRPYRKGLDPAYAVGEIEKMAGTQFDPVIVAALRKSYDDGKIEPLIQDFNKGKLSIVCPFCSTSIRMPEGSEAGDMFQCEVCQRRVRVLFQNDTYYGELLAGTE